MSTDTKRRRGMGRIFRRHNTWWIAYCVDGKERRESAHTTDYETAEDLLNRRVVQMQDGRLPAPQKQRKASVNALLDALKRHYEAHTRSAAKLDSIIKPLRKYFGDRRAATISTEDLDAFIIRQRKAGKAEETIGTQLSRLRQAFRLQTAIPVPKFPPLPKGQARDVLISPGAQRSLLAAMDDDCYRDLSEFAFATGWRAREILTLEWRFVRREAGVIRLAQSHSKTNKPRDFPLAGRVLAILERREAERVPASPLVFHKDARPICYRTWLNRWQRAAVKCGLGQFDAKGSYRVGVSIHDARRAFVTEALAAPGNDPSTVMQLTGHRTQSMLDRYNIRDAEALRRTIERTERYVEQLNPQPTVIKLPSRLSENPVREENDETAKSNAA
jgi:integrase